MHRSNVKRIRKDQELIDRHGPTPAAREAVTATMLDVFDHVLGDLAGAELRTSVGQGLQGPSPPLA
jgi:hypothetical protein